MRIKVLPLSFAVLYLGCRASTWKGFVYPDKSNLADFRVLGQFTTLDDCRASAMLYLRDLRATELGDYECGRDCKHRPELGVDECEETVH